MFIAFVSLPEGSVSSRRFEDCVWNEREKEDLKMMPAFLTRETGSGVASGKVTFQVKEQRFENRKQAVVSH